MTGHEAFEDLILRLPDGDLDPAERDRLREHLRSCPDCRRLFDAMAAVTEDLDGDVPLPEDLHGRILSGLRAAGKPKRRAPWRAVAGIAAAFVLVAGGVFIARDRLSAASAAAPKAAVEYAAAEADAGMPVPAPAEAPELPEAEEAPAEAAMELMTNGAMEAAAEESADAARGAVYDADPVYPLEAPAAVPEGREADFEALLGTVRSDDTMGAAVIAYVEYRGVIYEFSSDGTYLYWRDAAEGAEPNLSPASPDALWDILG